MRRSWVLKSVVAFLVGATAGCRDEPHPSGQERADRGAAADTSPRNTLSKPAGGSPLTDADTRSNPTVGTVPAKAGTGTDAEPPEIPKVLLTQSHAAMCRVQVGDVFPPLRLVDLDGTEQDLASLFGEKLTIVYFWTGELSSARTGLADLAPDVATPYQKQGVRVVAVAVKQSPSEAEQHVADAEATFVNLVDPDGSAFAEVGTGMLPRIFAVDSEGKIVWFDVEYSRSTRRDLRQAIRAVVGDPEP